ncbi:MAG: hypothetical protein CMO74_10660 [Verrucomicrobiales bacterium]|nr:hypothetical protein [Verrucomicrobiales bacterium]
MRAVFFFLSCICPVSALAKVSPPPPKLVKAWKLDPFYTKHLSVNGFPIIASKNVSDHALREAAYLIRNMLGQRKDLLRALVKNKVRFSIIAHNEYTTDIPEHRRLQPRLFWNRRARGLGPSKDIPVVSCGEENLLNYPGDPYSTENILIHEFAHAIHSRALSETDPTFDDRLKATHEAALKAGLWKGKYAGRNHHEYWAEGVQSWFGTNREDDHDHNHVNTRAELEKYDPALAKLVAEVFGKNDWQYQHPADRQPASAHLKGFEPKAVPTFAWSAKANAWYQRYRKGLETLAPDHAVELELLSPESENWRSPRTPHETEIFIANATGLTLHMEWIDFAGKAKVYGTLRPTGHFRQRTFAGHIWRISDAQTGQTLHYFITPKAPGQLVLKNLNKNAQDGKK